MNVDLRDLELLEALEQHGTLTAAAEHLFVSQPALSQRLVRLEERLGTQLFDRKGRGLVVNPAGKRMMQAARVTLYELRDAVRDVSQLQVDPSETIRFWSQCPTNYDWLPGIVQRFRQQCPAGGIAIEPNQDLSHIEALLERRIDVALITKLDQQMDRVRLERVFDDELVAVVGIGHSWVGKPYIEAEDFSDIHLILFDSFDPERDPPIPLPIPAGATPGRLTTLPMFNELLIETINHTDAVTVMPSWIAAPFVAAGRARSVQIGRNSHARTWYCATRHGSMPRHLEVFVDLVGHALDGDGRSASRG